MAAPFVVGRHHLTIGAPPRRVFDYLSDIARHDEWNQEQGFRVTAHPQGPVGVGSVLRREKTGVMRGPLIIRGGMGDNPVKVDKTVTVIAFEPYYALAFETRNSYNGLLASIDKVSFDLRQELEGTRVAMVLEAEAMVPSVFMGPAYAIRMISVAYERLLGERLAGLFPQKASGPYLPRIKELLETGDLAGDI